MKTSLTFLFGLLALAAAMSGLYQASLPAPGALVDLVPAGPLLVLQTKDFSSLVQDWNGSKEKQLWLESDNYQVFSRSRLFLRLQEAHEEFAAAAGFPPDMSMVEELAGSDSVLALYDIGKLEFLYLSRLPAARAAENVLWKRRGDYTPRNAAGLPYFVRVDPASRRVVAFATAGDILLLATREELLAGALTLSAPSSGSRIAAVKGVRWFDQATRAAGPPGDLRLAMNLEALVRSPHFRSYWIQRNVSELRAYGAAVSDIHRSADALREERVLVCLDQSGAAAAQGAALSEALRLAPEESGLYRVWAAPPVERALELLERKVLAPRLGPPEPGKTAPGVWLSGGEVGSEADLEIRIDEAPLENVAGAFVSQALRRFLEGAKLDALLQLQSSRSLPDGVFVGNQSAIVLLASTDWDVEAARGALLQAVESLWTISRLGANWVERRKGAHAYHELDGLARVAVAAQGRVLVVADRPELLLAVLEKISAPPAAQGPTDAVYAAGFRHSRERQPFVKMMSLMDHPQIQAHAPSGGQEAREPQFFSENIAGLSRALARVESASIVVRETGPAVFETVVYRLMK